MELESWCIFNFPWTYIHMLVFKAYMPFIRTFFLPPSFSFFWISIVTPGKIEPSVMESPFSCAMSSTLHLLFWLDGHFNYPHFPVEETEVPRGQIPAEFTYLISEGAGLGSRLSDSIIHCLTWSHNLMMSKHLCLQTTNWLSSLPRPKLRLDLLNHEKWLERPSFFSCICLHKVLISSHINPWRLSPCKYLPRECRVFVGSLSIPPYLQTSPTPSISTPFTFILTTVLICLFLLFQLPWSWPVSL